MLVFRKSFNNVDKAVFEKILKQVGSNGEGEIEIEEFKQIMQDFLN